MSGDTITGEADFLTVHNSLSTAIWITSRISHISKVGLECRWNQIDYVGDARLCALLTNMPLSEAYQYTITKFGATRFPLPQQGQVCWLMVGREAYLLQYADTPRYRHVFTAGDHGAKLKVPLFTFRQKLLPTVNAKDKALHQRR